MKIADMHCDTVYMLLKKRRGGEAANLLENTLHMDLQKMKQGDYLLQNFAIFVHQNETDRLYEECRAEYDVFADEMEKNKELISQVFSYRDIEKLSLIHI